MTTHEDDIRGRDEIESLLADVPEAERAELRALAQRLSDRPLPRAALRAEIRARIPRGGAEPQPGRVRRLAAAYLGSGAFLLAVAVAGVAGIGPLAS